MVYVPAITFALVFGIAALWRDTSRAVLQPTSLTRCNAEGILVSLLNRLALLRGPASQGRTMLCVNFVSRRSPRLP